MEKFNCVNSKQSLFWNAALISDEIMSFDFSFCGHNELLENMNRA